jgi:hypothetical protein
LLSATDATRSRALREAGYAPDSARVRDPEVVERFGNDTDSSARVLMFSSITAVAAVDSDKIRHLDDERRRRHRRQADEWRRVLG